MIKRGRDKTLAPFNIQLGRTTYVLGDVHCMNILVTGFPKEFNVGLMSHYINDPQIRISMITSPLNHDLTNDLRKEYRSLEEQWQKSKDPTEQERLRVDLQKLHQYIQEQVSSNDHTVNVLVVFTLRAESEDELNVLSKNFRERLKTHGFKIATPSALKMGLLKATTPVWMDHGIQSDVHYGLGVPMTTTSLAGMYPYIYSQLKDTNGFLFGNEYYNGGIVLWDPMLYENNQKKAVEENRLSGNVVLVGATGSGKTTDMNLIIMWMIREQLQLIWIDPENKNEHLTERLGGMYIPWGTKGNMFNIFQLQKASFDEDEDQGLDPWDTELAIYSVIDDFKTVLKLYNHEVSEDTLAWVGEITIEMFRRKGITFETPFRHLQNTDYPVLSDFNEVLQEKIEELTDEDSLYKNQLQDLGIKIKPMIVENKYYFDGHTTITVDPNEKKMISFGTRLLNNKDRGLKDALNFLMFRFAWGLCLDENHQSAFVIDEAHDFILEGKSAEQIALFYRRSRKYHNMMVLGTQETRDFAAEGILVHGRAIFNNSTYLIIKKLKSNAIQYLDELTTINQQEATFIERAGRGDALFICGNKRLTMRVFASETELNWIEPDRKLST